MRYGAEYSQRPAHHHAQADGLARVAQIISITDSIPVFAAEKARLRRCGLSIPDFDLLIGATAITLGMTLVTNNTAHFSRMAGISLANWQTEPLLPTWLQ